MSADDGFIELRLNRQDELAGENFWPSFTDIMTVIVMIFLMVMVVLVLYNQELVRDLQASIEKERIARETARVTGEEKESIAVRLHAAESEVAELLARLRRSEEQRGQQEMDGEVDAREHLVGPDGDLDRLDRQHGIRRGQDEVRIRFLHGRERSHRHLGPGPARSGRGGTGHRAVRNT